MQSVSPRQFCLEDDLSTYDPYDIWTTRIGFLTKNFYNHRRKIGILPAAMLTVFDTFLNDRLRLFYKKREYPIVRALAAQTLLNLYEKSRERSLLVHVKRHLTWLAEHACKGYNGCCWGLGWRYPVSKGLVYGKDAPYSTVTPYVLEAYVNYTVLSGDDSFHAITEGIFWFFERDILILQETQKHLVTSYGAVRDRVAYNAVSYSMYAYALLLPYMPEAYLERSQSKIQKMYRYIRDYQAEDGSWYYSPEGTSFIDCFHSCFVLKNIWKTNEILPLPQCQVVIAKGYEYLKRNLYDARTGLFRRFSVRNKPGVVRYDLYDNAEMLNLAILLKDEPLVLQLAEAIERWFCHGSDIHSKIDVLGGRRCRNTLRWAVMPYLYALSKMALVVGPNTREQAIEIQVSHKGIGRPRQADDSLVTAMQRR